MPLIFDLLDADMYYYKIVDSYNGEFRTLFHGINGSKILPAGEWLTAEKKEVSDGGGTKYISGFHVMRTFYDAKKYLNTKFKNKEFKVIILCKTEGIRKKEHSRDDVYLADKIFIEGAYSNG